jgi:hypothetical protein
MADVTRVGATEFARPNDTQLIATRVLDAPRDLVWAHKGFRPVSETP